MRTWIFRLFFVVFGWTTPLHAQLDTVTVELETRHGFGPFKQIMSICFEFAPNSPYRNTLEKVSGLPDALQKLSLRIHEFDFEQYIYQSYKNNLIASKLFFNRHSAGLDTTRLTSEYVDGLMSVLVAEDAEENIVVILDTDNDENFSDEATLIFPKRSAHFYDRLSKAEKKTFTEQLPTRRVTFEYYDGEHIQQARIDVKVNPYLVLPAWFKNPEVQGMPLGVGLSEHRIGQLQLPEGAFNLAVHSVSGIYRPESTALLVDETPTDGFIAITEGNEPYHIGDVIDFGRQRYEFHAVSLTGHRIILVRRDAPAFSKIPRVGELAREIETRTLDGSPFKLSSLRGKYVLLDFWGSWCAPCLQELPFLKDVYNGYGAEQIAIVGVAAYDEEKKLRKFLEEWEISWIQLHQSQKNDTILKAYGVKKFPTTFLLDPTGKIIARDLRGYGLSEHLFKRLAQPETFNRFVLSGNAVFTFRSASANRVLVTGSFSDWIPIPLYKQGDQWIRHIRLQPGNYPYKFIVDGEMVLDPSHADTMQTDAGMSSRMRVGVVK